MHLYLVYCGYYESDSPYGWNERHVTVPVVASDEAEAIKKFKSQIRPSTWQHVHVDGLLRIEAVDGFKIEPHLDDTLEGKSQLFQVDSPWNITT